ncbi:MAG: glycerol-3-phosphate dehydrogenase/oxidase [Candidatus Nanopelagicales bacterium]
MREYDRLSPEQRREAIAHMRSRELDVLIIGGGVVGAGAALDAASRGLDTGMIEMRDYASGTSSRSTKLFHGGLRYLQTFDFGLVFEALRERALVLHKLAPHLAHPVEFVYPITSLWDRLYVGLGIGVYDVMGAGRGVPSHLRHLGRARTLENFPGARPEHLLGGITFYEGQVDDARHTMLLARTATKFGALIANSVQAVSLLREGERVIGVRALDAESGEEFDIQARQVINAAGVWTHALLAADAPLPFRVRASKGVHLLVPRSCIDSNTGIITQTEKSVLFVVPWGEHWVIGTTDTDWDLDLGHPAASGADIDYLLNQVNAIVRRPLTRADVVGVYAGLRPLISGAEGSSTTKLSRKHAVASPLPGLVVAAGGKYTTYRTMAADAVDMAVRGIPKRVGKCRTAKIPLLGAEKYEHMLGAKHSIASLAQMPEETIERLLGRYGSLIDEIFDLLKSDPDLHEAIPGAPGYLKAEAVYAVTHEGALHLDDILARRTRISIESADRGMAASAAVAQLVAPLLGWSAADVKREVETYKERVESELLANQALDDEAANALRKQAPDSRRLSDQTN